MSQQQAMTVSMSLKENTNIPHNNREMEEAEKKKNTHIDDNKKDDNIILKRVDIKELYGHEFGEALEKYNENKIKSRKIGNYYEHVKNSKVRVEQREMIVQVGNMDDILNGTLELEDGKEMLEEWFEEFEERNPNLKVYNAVIHMDEIYKPDGTTVTTPHLHLNFVPVADDYKQGLDKQVSFDKALTQQNDEFDQTRPFVDWRESEVEAMEKVMKSRGIKRKEVETHDSMSIDRYQEVRGRERAVEKKEKSLEFNNKVRDKVYNDKVVKVDEREEKLKEKEADVSLKALKNDSKESELDKRENNVETDEEAVKTDRVDFEGYKKEEEGKLKEREANVGLKESNNKLVASELETRENNVGIGEEALKTAKKTFNDDVVVPTREKEKVLNTKESDLNNIASDLKTEKSQLNLKAIQLRAKEGAMKSWDKVRDRIKEITDKFKDGDRRERERLVEVIEEHEPLTEDNLTDFSESLDELAGDGEITLNDDDMKNLDKLKDKGIQQ